MRRGVFCTGCFFILTGLSAVWASSPGQELFNKDLFSEDDAWISALLTTPITEPQEDAEDSETEGRRFRLKKEILRLLHSTPKRYYAYHIKKRIPDDMKEIFSASYTKTLITSLKKACEILDYIKKEKIDQELQKSYEIAKHKTPSNHLNRALIRSIYKLYLTKKPHLPLQEGTFKNYLADYVTAWLQENINKNKCGKAFSLRTEDFICPTDFKDLVNLSASQCASTSFEPSK